LPGGFGSLQPGEVLKGMAIVRCERQHAAPLGFRVYQPALHGIHDAKIVAGLDVPGPGIDVTMPAAGEGLAKMAGSPAESKG
jgi:hypothetical protein